MWEHYYLLLFQRWQLEILQNQKTSVECSTSLMGWMVLFLDPWVQVWSHSGKQIALSSLQPLTWYTENTPEGIRGCDAVAWLTLGFHSPWSDSEVQTWSIDSAVPQAPFSTLATSTGFGANRSGRAPPLGDSGLWGFGQVVWLHSALVFICKMGKISLPAPTVLTRMDLPNMHHMLYGLVTGTPLTSPCLRSWSHSSNRVLEALDKNTSGTSLLARF